MVEYFQLSICADEPSLLILANRFKCNIFEIDISGH